MANVFQAAWSVLSGDYLRRTEQKFSPLDPSVNWQYINHLVYTANTEPYASSAGDGNSAVFACLLALSLGSIEPPLIVMRKDTAHGGELEPQPDHPLQAFLDDPNPDLDMLELRFWTTWARHADGNAYLVKQRNGTGGMPVQLWPVSPTKMRPYTTGSDFITDYEYDRPQGGHDYIPKADVIHFKLGVDPLDPRKGLSPLRRLVREVASDAEATKFMDALLRNFGIPGLIAALPAEANLSPAQVMEMKDRLRQEFGSDSRGKVGVLTGGASMQQFGFSPDQLNMKVLHEFPETRICAVMGVDPLVARLGVGLEQSSNYASSKQVRENFTELTLGPMWRMDEAKWNRSLRPDFTSDRAVVIKHDLSEVRALQEDENAKHQRIREDWKAGLLSKEVALRELGYDAEQDPEDTLLLPSGATFVRVRDVLTQPDTTPALPPGASDGGDNLSAPPKAQDVFGDVVQAIVDKAAIDFEADLQKLQDGQKRRVQRAIVKDSLPA
jgi:HK97 family phage portal protein